MESEAKYIIVGTFVLIATVVIVAGLFWISDLGERRNVTYYSVYFKQQSLEGLQKDSAVTMKGIKVGTVADYRISSRNIEEVRVTLRLDRGTPVKKDTSVVLKRNLLTGLATLDLVGSTQESELLREVPQGEPYPVIPEGLSKLEKIAESIPDLLEQINKGVSRAVVVFSEENLHSVESTLKNLEQFSGALAENRGKVEKTLTSLEQALSEISELSKSARSFLKSFDGKFDGMSQETVNALRSLEDTLRKFDQKTAEISFAVKTASRVFSQEVSTISQNVSEAAGSFSRTMESFEDPRKIITGPSEKALGPGESLKR